MSRPKTALIVDDEPHVHVYLRILLKQLGVETVWVAFEGFTALELAAAHKPEVVLLDMNLPKMSGMEVLKKLKEQNPATHVVIVSVESKPETLVQAHDLGADAYVLKHLSRTKLLQMLSDVFDGIAEGKGAGPAPGGASPAASA